MRKSFGTMKKIIGIIGIILLHQTAFCQARFLGAGTIEYERRINVHRQFENDLEADQPDFWKEFISKQPRFQNSYFNLSFNKDKAIYQPGREPDKKMEPWLLGPAKENQVLTDFNSGEILSRRKVFEENFVVRDSLGRVSWKITSETREIAGFECRKAVGVISDSVYVVAFYTDEIPVSGGPESFGGLPGMILGLAVPRLYTTWFATKVEITEAPAAAFRINERGKKINAEQVAQILKSTFTDWGKRGEKYIWWSLL